MPDDTSLRRTNTLGDKIKALKLVWGEEDIDRLLLWSWDYAVAEASFLQLGVDCDEEVAQDRFAYLAMSRTVESVDQIVNLTRLLKNHYEEQLKNPIEYVRLRGELSKIGKRLDFITSNNFEALIHRQHYEPLEDLEDFACSVFYDGTIPNEVNDE